MRYFMPFAALFCTLLLCCSCSREQQIVSPTETASFVNGAESDSVTIESDIPDIYIPESSTEFTPEAEHNGVDVQIFFTNTMQIDSDEGLPLSGQLNLAASTQIYLNGNGFEDTKEVTLIDDSIEVTSNSISFKVTLDAYPDVILKITYLRTDDRFTYTLLEW